jgi:hypothetical protein
VFLFTSIEWDSPYLCTCVEKLILGGYNSGNLKAKVKFQQTLYIPEQVLRDSRRLGILDFKAVGT